MPDEPEETGGLSVLECAVIGLAVGAAAPLDIARTPDFRLPGARAVAVGLPG